MNSGKVTQSILGPIPYCMVFKGIASIRVMLCIARSRSSTRHGAKPKPQLTMATEVTPCQPDMVQYGSQKRLGVVVGVEVDEPLGDDQAVGG